MSDTLDRLCDKWGTVMELYSAIQTEMNKHTGARYVLEVHWPDESVPPRILVRPGTAEEIRILDGLDAEPAPANRVLN